METVRQLGIPFGVVLNRAGVGDGKTEEYCRKENTPILMTIPLDTNIAGLYSQGVLLAEGMPEYKKSFVELYGKIGEMVNERSTHTKR